MSYKQKSVISIFFLLTALCLAGFQVSTAPSDVYPEYVIVEGDFLSIVAARFQTTVDEIVQVNRLADPNTISIGDRIKIPSLKGYSGTISTTNVNLGDSLRDIAIKNEMNPVDLAKINRLSSQSELYVGKTLMIIVKQNQPKASYSSLSDGTRLVEEAVRMNENPMKIALLNDMEGVWDFTDRQAVYLNERADGLHPSSPISPLLTTIEVNHMPLMQGEAAYVHVKSTKALQLKGNVLGQDLIFHQEGADPTDQYGFFAIDALQDTGLVNLTLSGVDDSQNSFDINQKIVIEPGLFTYEIVMGVDPATLEDHSNQVDRDALAGLTTSSAERSWGEQMSYPVDAPCIVSNFGNRRTYNDGNYSNFHSGVDFGVCSANNINIYAVADGTVLFAQELPVHGLHTVIDHGWSVYSTYSHQSEIFVTPGQTIKRGELIGYIGNTGRSVGPHLHFEIKVNGIYVNPMSWINYEMP